MAEIILDIDITGEDSLDQDAKDFKNYVLLAIKQKAVPAVQMAMYETLAKHIDEDVYEAYEPKIYERRRGGANALDDFGNKQIMSMLGPIGGATATGNIDITGGISYDPRGYHEFYLWSSNDDPNAIIGRIENKNPPYRFGAGVPKRPFWQRTVNELIDGGEIGKTFIQAMKEAGLDIEMAYDEVQREPRDGDY